jgi:hypothetical protein
MSATEYFRRNCWVGVSQPGQDDAAAASTSVSTGSCGERLPARRGHVPVHAVSTCASCSTTPTARDARDPRGNAAKLYDFDLDKLAPFAAKAGPTVAELHEPLTKLPKTPNEHC